MSETPISQRGEISFELAGKEFIFEPSFARIDKVETELGRPLIQLATEMAMIQRLSFRDTAVIVHTMGKGHKLSLNEVGDLIVKAGLTNVVKKLRPFFEKVLDGGVSQGNLEAAEGNGGQPSPGGDGSK